MTPPRLRPASLAAALLLAALASCARDAPPASAGATHLDPRHADGSAPLERLGAPPEVVRGLRPTSAASAADELAPWRAHNLRFLDATQGAGVLCRAADYDPAKGLTQALFEWTGEVDAGAFNRVELDLYAYEAGTAALVWGAGGRAYANTRAASWQTVTLTMAGDESWRGRVRGLRLLPCLSGPQTYELREVRLVRVDFEPGPQPSARHGDPGGDAGLCGPGRDLRRAWPVDPGDALHDACRVPDGARLAVEVNLAGGARERYERVTFRVEARDGVAWRELARLDARPREDWTDLGWRTLEADLAADAGAELELRFVAEATPERGAARGDLLWAAPRVSGPRAADPRPDLVLVTLDTLRADAVGAYSGVADTPFLDELAARGVLFEDAWTACNSTLPSHASLLTGLPVPAHGLLDNASTLAPEVRGLAQALRARGYLTAAAVSVGHLEPGWSGLGRGFDRYHEVVPGGELDGARTLTAVAGWLDEFAADPARPPLFLWVHLFDPHTPYASTPGALRAYEAQEAARGEAPPERTATPATVGTTTYTAPGGFLEGVTNEAWARHLYAAGVAYTDGLMRAFVKRLEQDGLLERGLLVVTADHGESLGEHDVWYGHQRLHPEVTRVPLLLLPPRDAGLAPGLRVVSRASTLDVPATFAHLAGVSELELPGEDLYALARQDDRPDRRVWFVHASGEQAGCRDDAAHYWRNLLEYDQLGPARREPAGKEELYLLADDPGARTDAAARAPELAERYRDLLEAWLGAVGGGRSVEQALDPEQRARLRALGYTGDE
ncbi:MAG: sulfatase [Planctomycetes bacterium]|nr:sulfatase [Planctomycetota bacterium]